MVIIIEASMCVSRARIVRAGFDTGTSVYRTFDLIETTNLLAKLRWQTIGRVWLLQVLTATVAELVPARPDHHSTLHVTPALVKIGSTSLHVSSTPSSIVN